MAIGSPSNFGNRKYFFHPYVFDRMISHSPQRLVGTLLTIASIDVTNMTTLSTRLSNIRSSQQNTSMMSISPSVTSKSLTHLHRHQTSTIRTTSCQRPRSNSNSIRPDQRRFGAGIPGVARQTLPTTRRPAPTSQR